MGQIIVIDPDDPTPPIDPGEPGYTPPPSDVNTKIAFATEATNVTITDDMITAAGGPWSHFIVRVTPVNDFGSGTSAEHEIEITDDGVIIIDGQIS